MKRALPVLLPYAVFAVLALVSWNRWIQPYVDTGRELMVPWRVARGEALYREVHFHHGPLAPYTGALIERLAGRSLAARTAFAALLALLTLEALRRLAGRVGLPGRAGLACGLTVALAFFLSPGGWLFPFSFDTAIAVAALTWALVLVSRKTAAADLGTAVCLAAALLARVEVGLAAAAAIALEARGRPRRLLRLTVVPLAGAALGYAAVSAGIPFPQLVSDGWLALLRPPEAFRNVYRSYAGLDRPALRLAELALAAVLFVLVAALVVAAAAVARAAGPRTALAGLVEAFPIALLAAAAVLHLRPPARLAETIAQLPPLVRLVPIAVILAAAARIGSALTRRTKEGFFAGVPDGMLLLAAVFGARLLLAAGYAGPYNAFFLPLPVLAACAGLWGVADRAAPATGEALPRLVTASLAVLLVFRVLVLAGAYGGRSWTSVQTPAGSLVLREPLASTTRRAIEDLGHRLPARATLTGFPEAGFFNYVLGRRNPTSLEQFFPGHLDRTGEARLIGQLQRTPPDAVVLINVLAVGEGARAFGKDYLVELHQAIQRDFAVAASFGPGAGPEARIGDPGFFIEIRVPLRRAP